MMWKVIVGVFAAVFFGLMHWRNNYTRSVWNVLADKLREQSARGDNGNDGDDGSQNS